MCEKHKLSTGLSSGCCAEKLGPEAVADLLLRPAPAAVKGFWVTYREVTEIRGGRKRNEFRAQGFWGFGSLKNSPSSFRGWDS